MPESESREEDEKTEPWITPTGIGRYLHCPRHFWAAYVKGVWLPRTPEHIINSGIDETDKQLMRDSRRANNFLKVAGITEEVPYRRNTQRLVEWQEEGIKFRHEKTGLLIGGLVDALLNPKEQSQSRKFVVMDGKSTALETPHIPFSTKYREQQVRQIAFYRWVLKQMGYAVADYGYLYFHVTPKGGVLTPAWEGIPLPTFKSARVQKNPDHETEPEEAKFMMYPFMVEAHKHTLAGAQEAWIEPTLQKIKECLGRETAPPPGPNCEYCKHHAEWDALMQESQKDRLIETLRALEHSDDRPE